MGHTTTYWAGSKVPGYKNSGPLPSEIAKKALFEKINKPDFDFARKMKAAGYMAPEVCSVCRISEIEYDNL